MNAAPSPSPSSSSAAAAAAVATRSRASLVNADLSLAALEAAEPMYPGLRACDRCRERKVRCDRKSPRCTICIKRNEICITTPLLPHQRGGKPWSEEMLVELAQQEEAQLELLKREGEGGEGGEGPVASTSTAAVDPPEQQARRIAPKRGSKKRARTRRGTRSSSTLTTPATTAAKKVNGAAGIASPSSLWATGAHEVAGGGGGYGEQEGQEEENGEGEEDAAMTIMTMMSPAPSVSGSAYGSGSGSGSGSRTRRRTATYEPNDDDEDDGEIVSSPVASLNMPRGGTRADSPSDLLRQRQRQRENSSSSVYYGSPAPPGTAVNDDTPGSHVSVASSSHGDQAFVIPRIYAPATLTANQNGGVANGTGTGRGGGGAGGGGYDWEKRERRRVLCRALVEGREAPFERIQARESTEEEGIDLERLRAQLETCDSAYTSPPNQPPTPPLAPSASTSPSSSLAPPPTSAPPQPAPISSSSSLPAPLFSTSRTPCDLFCPTSHQSHMCLSTYFSRLEPALELFLPGPTVAHRFLQECSTLWASGVTPADDIGEGGRGRGKGREGWNSIYLAGMAMGAMAMTEAEWASIGCGAENKVRAGATWLEEAGRLLVENGFARKPTLESFRASLLILQSCLIGLNGPPDIPLVLESLPMITSAAYELGLHVEPDVARFGEEEADERRGLWWRLLELQVCWAPLLDHQLPLDPSSFSTAVPPFVAPFPSPLSLPQQQNSPYSPTGAKAEHGGGDEAAHLLAQQQQAASALASLHAVLDFSCRAYHAATAPRPLRARELDKLSQRLMDLSESRIEAAATRGGGGGAGMNAMADLMFDVEVCRLQALADEVEGPEDDELEELWNVHAARLLGANPLAGPQVSHTLAMTLYLHGLLLIALRLRDAPPTDSPDGPLRQGMATALETLRTAPWPLPLHQIIQRGIAILEAVVIPAPMAS
ncbi:hypothetical protein JCM10908_005672 [Rhodotorula pacifica]|uniref:Zn(II)2Cys6 transcription factor n=1 Tax=Rhodotorula pacifica TaxID=1495444 RepID=UPI00317DAA9B